LPFVFRLARDNGISGANMRQRIASRIVTNRRKQEKAPHEWGLGDWQIGALGRGKS
jgi:hypothetical protein